LSFWFQTVRHWDEERFGFEGLAILKGLPRARITLRTLATA
jgi:hypothetical protein